VKFRPLSWRSAHSYVLVDRFEDITPPQVFTFFLAFPLNLIRKKKRMLRMELQRKGELFAFMDMFVAQI
jgi:hypothetical protein